MSQIIINVRVECNVAQAADDAAEAAREQEVQATMDGLLENGSVRDALVAAGFDVSTAYVSSLTTRNT